MFDALGVHVYLTRSGGLNRWSVGLALCIERFGVWGSGFSIRY